MKRGFTLIELLAVIVILAIIALIATPAVSKIIEKSKRSAAYQNAIGYVKVIENQMIYGNVEDDTKLLTNGTYVVPLDPIYGVTFKGKGPSSGWIRISNNKVNSYSLVINGYIINKNGDNVEIIKENENNDKSGETIIYRFSEDVLYNGDTIDLKNRKYTTHHEWNDELDKEVDATHDMVGVYSTKLSDVLTISTNYNGESIETRSNPVYLKHTVNSEGIITKSETCLKTSWGTLCQVGGGVYDEAIDDWDDPNYETKKTTLFNFFKSETNTSDELAYSKYKTKKTALFNILAYIRPINTYTSAYEGFSCKIYSDGVDCGSSALGAGVYSLGDVYSGDGSAAVDCNVDFDGKSYCYS